MQPTAKEGVNAPRADMAVGSITKRMAYAALYHSSRKGTSALVLRFAGSPTFIHFSHFFHRLNLQPRPGPRRSSQNSQGSQGSGGSSQPLLLPSTLQTTYSEEAGSFLLAAGVGVDFGTPRPSKTIQTHPTNQYKSCVLFSPS